MKTRREQVSTLQMCFSSSLTAEQNKLLCMSRARFFKDGLIIASKVGAYPQVECITVHNSLGRLQDLPANVRISKKLAYFALPLVMKKKSRYSASNSQKNPLSPPFVFLLTKIYFPGKHVHPDLIFESEAATYPVLHIMSTLLLHLQIFFQAEKDNFGRLQIHLLIVSVSS